VYSRRDLCLTFSKHCSCRLLARKLRRYSSPSFNNLAEQDSRR